MRILRWFGLILMILAATTASAMFYMRHVVDSTPIYQAPHISGGTMVGGLAPDRETAKVFTMNIIISVLVFFAGLIAFGISRAFQKTITSANKKKCR
jgi:hypothetical protein